MTSRLAFEIPRITKPLYGADYHEDLDLEFRVWVNPSQDVLVEFDEAQAEILRIRIGLRAIQEPIDDLKKQIAVMETRKRAKDQAKRLAELNEQLTEAQNDELIDVLKRDLKPANDRFWGWYETILSQDKDASTHVSAADVEKFAKYTLEGDPALWRWFTGSIQQMFVDHRSENRKK